MVSAKAPTQKIHSRISIASAISKALPSCTPYLMPFHIGYSGPAPVSTYFRVGDAKTDIGSPEPSKDDSQTETASSSIEVLSRSLNVAPFLSSENNDIHSIASDMEQKTDQASSTSSLNPASNDQPRFKSTFRGRTVHGLKFDLPQGYTGVVFSSDDDTGEVNIGKVKKAAVGKGKGKAAATQQERRRVTRRSARSLTVDDEAMYIKAEDEGQEDDEEASQSTLNLVPSSQFKSFVLWHPDIPVDTGRDEYMSSISEWVKIAGVLHQAPHGITTFSPQ
ncbi:ribonuclease H2, subunit C [Lentinula aciculospora]|uniref:Ribonuclease H2, subunit C n=1 Tax=Lentinula aciculospora TaxID=153920 RepID=A0A9W9DJ93_9AGAR|nr:ribonuclease H2, subunit C [Lentinula aciculospora]